MRNTSQQKYNCDRSGFTYEKESLVRQRGLLVSADEVDDLSRIKIPNPKWRSPRDNSTTTTAVNSPTVFSITSAGVTALQQSHEYSQDGTHSHYYMQVIGASAPTTITADPAIIAGSNGNRLTLYGTSDTNYIIIQNGNGVSLVGGVTVVLKDKCSITFVYTSSDTTWRETSRNKDGFI